MLRARRQGSPLVPDNLRMMAASAASATIVVSDSTRCHSSLTVILRLLAVCCRAVAVLRVSELDDAVI